MYLPRHPRRKFSRRCGMFDRVGSMLHCLRAEVLFPLAQAPALKLTHKVALKGTPKATLLGTLMGTLIGTLKRGPT